MGHSDGVTILVYLRISFLFSLFYYRTTHMQRIRIALYVLFAISVRPSVRLCVRSQDHATHFNLLGLNHISGMAKARVVTFCIQVGYMMC